MNKQQVINKYLEILNKKNISDKTISNYKADLNNFLNWVNLNYNAQANYLPYLRKDYKNKYLNKLERDNISKITIKRRSTSINHLISNFQKQTIQKDKTILDKYCNYLKTLDLKPKTIRFYKSDIRQFTDWIESNDIKIIDINEQVLRRYYYETVANLSISTAKRKVSSIKGYLEWISDNNLAEYMPQDSNSNIGIRYSFKMLMAFFSLLFIILSFGSSDNEKLPWNEDIVYAKESVQLSNQYSVDFKSNYSFKGKNIYIDINSIQIYTHSNKDFTFELLNNSPSEIKLLTQKDLLEELNKQNLFIKEESDKHIILGIKEIENSNLNI